MRFLFQSLQINRTRNCASVILHTSITQYFRQDLFSPRKINQRRQMNRYSVLDYDSDYKDILQNELTASKIYFNLYSLLMSHFYTFHVLTIIITINDA